jgi:hypothetical protein
MEEGDTTLIEFFFRLVDYQDLLRRYLKDPQGVMREAGLSDYHIGLVMSANLSEIQKAIQSQFKMPVIVVPVI